MPDIFQAQETIERDQRFRNGKSPQRSATPSPVEPYLSKETTIPVAPVLRKPKYTNMHIFTSYCELPPNVTFENQDAGEKIILFLRKSFITNIMWLLFTLFFVVLPFGIMRFASGIFTSLPASYLTVLVLFYFLLVASYFFVHFITWYFNIVLVTDQRIVDIDFQDLVYKNIAETKLNLVQDVSYTETGVIRTVFDYGDVLIQTAGTIDNFDLHAVPLPERTVNIIEDLIGKGRGGVNG